MDLLASYADSLPAKPAVIDDRPGRDPLVWSFAELDAQANQLAHYLLERGAGPETKVIWCGPNSAGVVRGMHAIRRAGAVGVPLNYRLAADEAAYVIDNSDAEIVYVDAAYTPLVERIHDDLPKVREVCVFDGDGSFERSLSAMATSRPFDDVPPQVTMTYTSGTTGRPKGAVRSTRYDIAAATALVSMIGFVADDVYLTTGPLYHSGPGSFAIIAHALGNTVICQNRFDAEDWLRLVDRYSVTTTFTAPTPIRMICSLPPETKARYDRSSMRRLIANAAPWTLTLKKMYLADFPDDSLWEIYGSTELGIDTVLRPEEHLRKPGSCGRPAPGIEIKLFDDAGVEVTEPYCTGELYVRSSGVFSTYYKAEEKYHAASSGDFHTVGDVAYFDEEGFFYIADRKNDMIITGGMNVYPAEVEAALDACPAVYEVAVFGVPDDNWGESVHAAVVAARPCVTSQEIRSTAEEIQAYGREHLARYKVPRTVTFVEELPKTGSGKVLKRQLRDAVAGAGIAAAPPDG